MKCFQRGYSSFQLLFILFVVILLGLWSKQEIGRRQLETKIVSTAIQLDLWRNIVAVYYQQQGHWPSNTNDIVKKNYLPNKNLQCTSWPAVSESAANICGSTQGFTLEPSQDYLKIILPVSNLQVAAGVMQRLSDAYVDEKTNAVITLVFKPNPMALDQTSLMMKGFYDIDVRTQREVPKPKCPKNWQADYDLMLTHWYSHFYQVIEEGPDAGKKYPCLLSQEGVSAFRASDDISQPSYWQPRLRVALQKPFQVKEKGKGCENPLNGTVTAVTFCRPPIN